MLTTRVIPCLLLADGGLVKTTRFRRPRYIGDPINAVRIFNDKYVDEIVLLDISASKQRRRPNLPLIEKIISEAFMPFCYGGGVRRIDEAQELFTLGVEKVAVTSGALARPTFVTELADRFGSQSVVVGIDVRLGRLRGSRVIDHTRSSKPLPSPVDHARRMQQLGAGELFVNSVDRDGTMAGYDLELLRAVAAAVDIPVIACGGAGSLDHMAEAVSACDVSAVAAGSLFVFKGRHRAVLINYPSQGELRRRFEPDVK